ncbi:MAG: 2-hydroxyacid dehydrogenase [Thermoguttaceae bacterium]
MKLIAISDRYIPRAAMEAGLADLKPFGIEVVVCPWEHDTLEELQAANLKIEQEGPDAVPLPASLDETIRGGDIVVTQFPPISRRVIESSPKLKLIGVLRSGVENIDVTAATSRKISVFNTPGRNARAVAEATLALILAEVRNIARGHHALKSGVWTRDYPNKNDIPELFGRTVGLVGFGAVGRLVAKFLAAFDARVVVYDPFYRGDNPSVAAVSLETLLTESDVVSLHARYSPETRHMLGAREFAMMKPTAVLVNTARSGLVDERALVDALATRRIMGAALDVFDDEPLPPNSPFLTLDNVTLVPHLAGSTADAFRNTPRLFAANLIRCLQGESEFPVINGIAPRFG